MDLDQLRKEGRRRLGKLTGSVLFLPWKKGYVQVTFLIYNSREILIGSSFPSPSFHLHRQTTTISTSLFQYFSVLQITTVFAFSFIEEPVCQSIYSQPDSFFQVLATILRQTTSFSNLLFSILSFTLISAISLIEVERRQPGEEYDACWIIVKDILLPI
ncbi:hypothetical protein F4678DRAFT_227164 [Xylaria arbuscula]|nr:hypothetical protein F4678DRAFT_227164 [Xylaria arbuscula]